MSPKRKLEYKDIVGKLMSEENISIVHKNNASTASFDISSRTLFLPEFVDVSENVYDLLIGHEVSHALHTPEKGWHKSTEKRGANFKTFLNVVEDARIEKMIQKKFPGLKSSFKKGYKELYDMDLFGVKNKSQKEIDDLLLIDRLNLYFKLGQLQSGVSFKKEEMQYVEEMDNLKTWKDVVELAEKLFEYCKEEQKEKQQEQGEGDPQVQTSSGDITGESQESLEQEMEQSDKSEDDQGSDQNEKGSDGSENDQNQNGSDGPEQENKSSTSSEESKSSEKNPMNNGENSGNNFDHKYNDEEPLSLTDKNFRENESNLNSQKNKSYGSSSECSFDLPIVDKDFFYDDWRKIFIQVAKWRESAMQNGW